MVASGGNPARTSSLSKARTLDDLDASAVAAHSKRVRANKPHFARLNDEDASSASQGHRAKRHGQPRPPEDHRRSGTAVSTYPQDFFPQLNLTFVHYPTRERFRCGQR